MKKLFKRCVLVLLAGLVLSACTAEELGEAESLSLNATATTSVSADILPADLVGTWNMYSMESLGVNVDFNRDGVRTFNLLEENNCFDDMYFTFDIDGNVQTTQSRLFFDGNTGEFTCQTTKDYVATYTLNGNELQVNFTVKGSNYTDSKTISRYSQNGEEFLKVSLTSYETDAAVYVANDPGNTVASEIQEIEMIYKRQ